ncbi:hypothetical protein FRC12_012474 [Ceratobasidium sp. 428]|nr:hypothetical protein FRC12_012474 [Ceratobasidium sp. 428]
MLTSALSLSLKDGVLTQWSSVSPSSYMPLQLDVAQLPSLNTGESTVTQWRLIEHGLYIYDYDIEPACNLLVLLEYTNFSPSSATDTINQHAGNKYRIHFRTLTTNSTHPDAIVGYLGYGPRTAGTWGFKIQCLGDIVVAYPPCSHTSDLIETGLLMYNWTTGALLVSIPTLFDRPELFTKHFQDMGDKTFVGYPLVVSKEVVVATRSTFTYGSQECPMGYLDIYSINWVGSPSMDLVASLELPVIHSVPAPSPGLHGLTNDSIAFHFHLTPGLGSHSSSVSAHTRGLPRIFEPAKSNQILGLGIILPYIGGISTPLDLNSAMAHLYIPVDIIYETLKSCKLGPPPDQTIKPTSWQYWSPRVRWIHAPLFEVVNRPRNQLAGSRCMLFSRTRSSYQTRFYMLDFNPHFLKSIEHCRLQPSHKITDWPTVPTGWTYQPAEANDVTPTESNVGPHTWLSDSYAEQAVAPYAWSSIQNEELHRVLEEESSVLLLDAEHIVTIRGNPSTEIVVFTL